MVIRRRSSQTYIIAEAGVNHNGSMDMACALVDVASKAGVDAVKFQTFRAGNMTTGTAPKAEYQRRATGRDESQLAMLKKLELTESDHQVIRDHCRSKGLDFLSTPFDLESLSMLIEKFEMPTVKISSGDITFGPLLLEAARRDCRIILSTGMSNLAEIETALALMAFGFLTDKGDPTEEAVSIAFSSEKGRARLEEKVSLLHCTTEYPAPLNEVNLRAMDTLAASFGLPVGFSDHTEGITAAVAAVARGASIIEKHFTLDRSLPGPDHRASLEPVALAEMVRAIREVESLLGKPWKIPSPSEIKNMKIARKSLVALEPICQGERILPAKLGFKRPGTGLSPMRFWEAAGSLSSKEYKRDEMIRPWLKE